mgnify:CR=1 FL=1
MSLLSSPKAPQSSDRRSVGVVPTDGNATRKPPSRIGRFIDGRFRQMVFRRLENLSRGRLTVVDADGEMEYAMLRIVGIINTGSRDMDAAICHVMLEDVERLTRLPGAGEISVTLDEPLKMDAMVPRLKEVVSPNDDILTWIQVVPAQGGDYQSDKGFMNMLSGTVIVVVILGIAGAQLTAILERRREFAVLIALVGHGLLLGLVFSLHPYVAVFLAIATALIVIRAE